MTTTLQGRIGGQYFLSLVGEDKYRVQGRMFSQMHTMYTGDYETCTKLMDYCVMYDATAQDAIKQMFYEGDPTMMLDFIEAAKTSTEARKRRRVAVTVEVETDVAEGEQSIPIVAERLAQACALAQCRVTLLQAFYSDPEDRTVERDLGRIARQRDFLLDHFVTTEDGTFTFPDGPTFPCRKRGEPIDLNLVRSDLAVRDAVASQDKTPAEEN